MDKGAVWGCIGAGGVRVGVYRETEAVWGIYREKEDV